jgi:hydroxymethylglutaryl-CoA reductase
MSILAVSGLAQNFAALRSLVTTGIQKGHMKMHFSIF